MTEVNGLVTLSLSLILAIPLAVLANLITPPVKNCLDGRSVAGRKKRLTELQEVYERVERYRRERQFFYADAWRAIAEALYSMISIALYILAGLSMVVVPLDAIMDSRLAGLFRSLMIEFIALLSLYWWFRAIIPLRQIVGDAACLADWERYQEWLSQERTKLGQIPFPPTT